MHGRVGPEASDLVRISRRQCLTPENPHIPPSVSRLVMSVQPAHPNFPTHCSQPLLAPHVGVQQKPGNTGGCELEPRQDPTRDVESSDYSNSGEVSSGTHVRRAVALVGLASTEAGEAVGLTTPTPGTLAAVANLRHRSQTALRPVLHPYHSVHPYTVVQFLVSLMTMPGLCRVFRVALLAPGRLNVLSGKENFFRKVRMDAKGCASNMFPCLSQTRLKR